jgi:hypothetical protein
VGRWHRRPPDRCVGHGQLPAERDLEGLPARRCSTTEPRWS